LLKTKGLIMKKQFLVLALLGFVSSYATMKLDVALTDGQNVAVQTIAINPEEEVTVELGEYKVCVCMKEDANRFVTIHCACHDKDISFSPAEQDSATLSVDENGTQVVVAVVAPDEVEEQTAE
jgi:hypothetical protein